MALFLAKSPATKARHGEFYHLMNLLYYLQTLLLSPEKHTHCSNRVPPPLFLNTMPNEDIVLYQEVFLGGLKW